MSDRDPTHELFLASRPPRYRGTERTSRYLVMRDGVRIAIDVTLPRGLAERAPTIVRQTRYFRRFRGHPLLRPLLGPGLLDPMNAPMRELFTARGYAWVDVDVRGSGASFGERPCPWWLEGEVADGAEIVEWIVNQPWSNGRVGSTGVSYDGTTAEFLATTRHPAVRAIAPRFCLFDVFADVGFPGGLHCAYFTDAWERANAALDRDEPSEMIALILSLQAHGARDPRAAIPGTLPHRIATAIDDPTAQALLRRVLGSALGGVAPVDDDPGGAIVREAMRSHEKNFSTHSGAVLTTFRDDSPPNAPVPGQTSDVFSPHTYVDRLEGVAVLGYGGWFDGSYANAAIKRQLALQPSPRAELLVGPWIHGGLLDMDPWAETSAASFDHAAELLRFFDRHLLDREPRAERVRYFVMGERAWRSAPAWPPPAPMRALHFAEGRRLLPAPGAGVDVHAVDLRTGAGKRSRYRTLLCIFLHADGRGRSPEGYFVLETPPLEEDWTIVGNPVLLLDLESSQPDGAIFAYLEEVTPSGEAHLFTEGVLRTIHRTRLEGDRVKASLTRADRIDAAPGEHVTHAVELLPTAMRVRKGHRLRLSLGGADVDHFTTPPGDGVVWRIHREGSRLLVPTLAAGR